MVAAVIMLTGALLVVGGLLAGVLSHGTGIEILVVLVMAWGALLHLGAGVTLLLRVNRNAAETEKRQKITAQDPD